MLPVTKELLQILLKKPIEIADPVQAARMDLHAESRIGEERLASDSCFFVTPINGDNSLEVAEGLSLQAIKAFGDEIGALINWQSHSDAWGRHCVSLGAFSRRG
jgi:hypothetical protein